MKNYYFLIDDAFLNAIPPEAQKSLKSDMDNYVKQTSFPRDECKNYVIVCPYCNHLSTLISRIQKIDNKELEPYVCVRCGESTPYHKIASCINKARILFDLSVNCMAIDKNHQNTQNARILLEQSIVVLATGIELYFKEIYIISLNLKYVKPEHSLHLKFSKDVKNDFLNIGKMVSKFKNEFKIDITDILGRDVIDKLNDLMLIRNVIVHNNGTVDNIFLNNMSLEKKKKYTIGFPIPITGDEIVEFINTTDIVLEKIETEFDKLIHPELQARIISQLSIVRFSDLVKRQD
jgi:hypothetical protein